MFIYKPYAIDAARYSIFLQQMTQSNNSFNQCNMHLIRLFDSPDVSVNPIGPTMKIFVICWMHHHLFFNMST